MSERTFTQAEVNEIVEKRLARQTRVTHEPRVYGLRSAYSYYADLWLSTQAMPDESHRHAAERLHRYGRELGAEIERNTPEGRRALQIITDRHRSRDAREQRARVEAEIRALTTGEPTATAAGEEGASFVSPAFLVDAWAPYRGIERAFADQCHKLPLPPFGMHVYIPKFTTGAKVAKQTEGAAVTETTPASALEGAAVETLSGMVTVTQQVLDRAFSAGGGMDVILFRQMHEQLDQEVDLYTLNQAITGGEAVSGEATYSTKGLYKDLALAREKLTDTAGTRLRPTHFFTTSDFYSFASRQVDSSERPIFQPWWTAGFPVTKGADDFDAAAAPQWSRFTGTMLPGTLAWFTDDNIPAVGTTTKTRLIVAAPEVSIVLFEGEPFTVIHVEPASVGGELKVILVLRQYTAAVTRHAAGASIVTGEGYKTTQV